MQTLPAFFVMPRHARACACIQERGFITRAHLSTALQAADLSGQHLQGPQVCHASATGVPPVTPTAAQGSSRWMGTPSPQQQAGRAAFKKTTLNIQPCSAGTATRQRHHTTCSSSLRRCILGAPTLQPRSTFLLHHHHCSPGSCSSTLGCGSTSRFHQTKSFAAPRGLYLTPSQPQGPAHLHCCHCALPEH